MNNFLKVILILSVSLVAVQALNDTQATAYGACAFGCTLKSAYLNCKADATCNAGINLTLACAASTCTKTYTLDLVIVQQDLYDGQCWYNCGVSNTPANGTNSNKLYTAQASCFNPCFSYLGYDAPQAPKFSLRTSGIQISLYLLLFIIYLIIN